MNDPESEHNKKKKMTLEKVGILICHGDGGTAVERCRKKVATTESNVSYWCTVICENTDPLSLTADVSTILGGGVLSIPFALSKTGIIGGPLLIIICAILSDFSLDLLLLSARYGSGVETFEEVAKKAYGRK
eukprot:g2985.t1